MKILPISSQKYQNNTNFKSANKFCRLSIQTLVASSALFMLSNAIDTFKPEKVNKERLSIVDSIASGLALAGTALGLFGIEKLDEKDENR